jgi:hypothetical protein
MIHEMVERKRLFRAARRCRHATTGAANALVPRDQALRVVAAKKGQKKVTGTKFTKHYLPLLLRWDIYYDFSHLPKSLRWQGPFVLI